MQSGANDGPEAFWCMRRKDGNMTQFWKKVREAVQGAAEDGAEAIKEGATAVAERAPKVAGAVAGKSRDALRIADLKIQIRRLNIQAEQRLSELGGRVYEVLQKAEGPVENDPAARSLVEKVRDIEKEIADAEKDVDGLRGKAGPARAVEEAERKAVPSAKPRRKAAKPATRTRPRKPPKSGRSKGSAAPGRPARPRKPAGGKAT
jgi:gas vesicle protein